MSATTGDVRVTSTGSSFINGELFTMSYKATGSRQDGTIETDWELSSVPKGMPILVLVDCTSAGVSPIFAREQNGAKNLLSLAGGNYRLQRTFDYGTYGRYEFTYEIRTSGDDVTSTGVQEGSLNLPEIESAQLSLVEYLIPAGPRRLHGFMRTSKTLKNGEQVPVNITGVYSPLDDDADWTLTAEAQVRRSLIEITESSHDNKLSLKYTTVVAPIVAPDIASGA